VNSEAFCSDAKISSDESIITCMKDNSMAGKKDFVDNTPVFPFYDMLLIKDDSHLSKSGLFTYFLLNYDSYKHILHSRKYQPKNPATDHYIYSLDYYIYTLEKIVI
jgi:hypothetical protein